MLFSFINSLLKFTDPDIGNYQSISQGWFFKFFFLIGPTRRTPIFVGLFWQWAWLWDTLYFPFKHLPSWYQIGIIILPLIFYLCNVFIRLIICLFIYIEIIIWGIFQSFHNFTERASFWNVTKMHSFEHLLYYFWRSSSTSFSSSNFLNC